MKKRFEYDVAGTIFTGNEAFGEAWHEAKAYAQKIHAAVYRTVTILEGYHEGEAVREVYLTGGCFLNVELVKPHEVKIW